ncbi:MAG: hypothetical protein C4583_10695 [Anaerolineaceae bacterium]|nr:MAG: hypothetical protein C4583_10695 [Anaerolineaceae bacterium]
MSIPLDSRLEQNNAFWSRSSSHPLVGIAVNITFPMLSFAKQFEEDHILPEMLHPEDFFAEWDRAHEETESRGEDLFSVASPLASVPWMEAILGCDIRVVRESGSMWAEPQADLELKNIRYDLSNPWLRKLVEFSNALREHADGRYPIGNPILRGVSDLISALLGSTQMVYAFYDRPEFVRELAQRCTDIWHSVAQELTQAKGIFMDGSCADRRRIWGRGTSLLYQDDAAVLTSPKIYNEFFLQHVASILKPYTNTIIHLHSESLHIMQHGLASLPELRAMEVLLGPSGPQGLELLGNFKEILKTKGLVICGEMSLDLIRGFLTELPHSGLSLQPKVNTKEEADLLWNQIREILDSSPPYSIENRESV